MVPTFRTAEQHQKAGGGSGGAGGGIAPVWLLNALAVFPPVCTAVWPSQRPLGRRQARKAT